MSKIRKIHFYIFTLLIVITIAGKAFTAFAFDPNQILNIPPGSSESVQQLIPQNANLVTGDDKKSSIVRTTCSKFPGFFNKIVKCITSMTTREVVFFTIWKISNVFASAANAMLVVYIVFFGLKMSMNALENNRNDIIVFLLVCFFVTFANNHVRIISALKFFMTVQNEFAYAATAAMYSSMDAQLKKDLDITNPSKDKITELQQKYTCYGPPAEKGLPEPGVYYNIWQRMDCLVVYMLGMHPLVTRLSQFTTDIGENSAQDLLNAPDSVPVGNVQDALDNTVSVLDNVITGATSSNSALTSVGALSGKHSYELMYSNNQPFEDMINDAFCWFKQKPDISLLTDANASALDKVIELKRLIQDRCFLRRIGLTDEMVAQINGVTNGTTDLSSFDATFFENLATNFADSMLTKPYPSSGDKYQVTLTSSLIVILVGSLFDSTFGFFSFVLGFGVILLMFFAFAQAVMVYVTSLFAILLLGLFAPIIIPLFLFKPTRGIFESWLQLFFVYSLQPGILLCYLTMMILVLQNILFTKHNIYKPDPVNPENYITEKASFVDLILGEQYRKADKTRKSKIEIYEKFIAGKDESFAGLMASQNQLSSPVAESSIYGSGEANYYVAGLEEASSSAGNPFSYGLFNTKNTGSLSSSISFPSFNFFGGAFGTGLGERQNLANAAISNFAKNNKVSSDLEAIFKDMKAGKTVDASVGIFGSYKCSFNYVLVGAPYTCENGFGQTINVPLDSFGKPDFSQVGNFILPLDLAGENTQALLLNESWYKLLFIQTLFIILITLAITISFMHTVMTLAGKLAGASATPIGKASAVYEILAGRLKTMAMKTG